MKILFAGTPEIAVPLLKELSSRFEVCGVLTSTDKAEGRSKTPRPSPVKKAATELGLKVLQFDTIKTEAREAVKATGANTLVTFAFGKIFGPKFLALFDRTFNVHPSALPHLRGPAPVQNQILEGLRKCSISLQSLVLKMDEGEIWAVDSFPLDGTENTETLSDKVAIRASEFVPSALSDIENNRIQCKAQEGEATYCTKIDREMAFLDFNKKASELHALVRAMIPWPKAWANVRGSTVSVTSVWGGFAELEAEPLTDAQPGTVVGMRKDRGIGVACADKVLWINGLQLPTKKELDHRAFVNGNPWILQEKFNA